MTKEQVIEQINNLPFMKEANMKVKKLRIDGNKNGGNRHIWIYFEKQKWPCGVFVSGRWSTYSQTDPSFVIGVDEKDKEYWSFDTRVKLCHWVFTRFWIYLKCLDSMYDMYVNGNWPNNSWMTRLDKWEVSIFTGLVHDGWCIQKYNLKHLLEMPPLKDMYEWYNDDVKDNLYKNFGYIEYYDREYKELPFEEFDNIRIGF